MSVNPIVIAIPIYFVLIAIEILFDLRKSLKSYRLNDAMTNISCGIVSQVSGAFLMVGLFGLYTFAEKHLGLFDLPIAWWTFIIAFLLFDFMYYWAHRLSHEINLFWGGHSVHHQSEEYNLTVALRQSSTQILWTFLFYLPLAIVGIDPYVFVISQGINLLYQFWIHTETIKKLPKWFEFVFNTPSHHRVHHARNDEYIDRNHGGTLIIWDRIFKTFTPEIDRPIYGITKPLNSWNPIWANFSHYVDIMRAIMKQRSLKHGLNIAFRKPGWNEKMDENHIKIPKFDNKQSLKLNIYIVIQFLGLLSCTLTFLYYFKDLEVLEKVTVASLILFSCASIGMLLENNRKGIYLEFSRLILVSISIMILWWSAFTPLFIALCLGATSLLLTWFWQSVKTIKVSNTLA